MSDLANCRKLVPALSVGVATSYALTSHCNTSNRGAIYWRGLRNVPNSKQTIENIENIEHIENIENIENIKISTNIENVNIFIEKKLI